MTDSPLLLDIERLQPGDLIFSTTPSLVSVTIRALSAGKYSHVSLYYAHGVIIEANDAGVGPTMIRHTSLAPNSASLAGLPYEDWISTRVLRHPSFQRPGWPTALKAILRKHVGHDFPPYAEVARPARAWKPFAKVGARVLDAAETLRGRDPIVYDAWCSRLVGIVLGEAFSHVLSPDELIILEAPTPQQVYDQAIRLGYFHVPAATCQRTAITDRSQFEELRMRAWRIQAATCHEWERMARVRRSELLQDRTARNIRTLARAVLAILILGLIGAIWLAARSLTPAPLVADITDGTRPQAQDILTRLQWKQPLPEGIIEDEPLGIQIGDKYRAKKLPAVDFHKRYYNVSSLPGHPQWQAVHISQLLADVLYGSYCHVYEEGAPQPVTGSRLFSSLARSVSIRRKRLTDVERSLATMCTTLVDKNFYLSWNITKDDLLSVLHTFFIADAPNVNHATVSLLNETLLVLWQHIPDPKSQWSITNIAQTAGCVDVRLVHKLTDITFSGQQRDEYYAHERWLFVMTQGSYYHIRILTYGETRTPRTTDTAFVDGLMQSLAIREPMIIQ